MFFDTHAHFDHRKFDPDREHLLDTMSQKGLSLIMNIGCNLSSSLKSVSLANKYPFLYATVGSHPDDAANVTDATIAMYRQLAANGKVMAIGEIGLDYHYEEPTRDIQIPAFERQLQLAQELDLPVVIHEREAHGDALAILRNYPNVRGVFHCYSGSWEMARQLLDRGWYLGFTGVLTFKNARKTVEVAQKAPLDRIVLETDCPYMAPEPHRGRRCDSGYLPYTAARLAELRQLPLEQIAAATLENGKRLYGIPD